MDRLLGLCERAILDIKDKFYESYENIKRDNASDEETLNSMIQIFLELTTETEPKWLEAAAKLSNSSVFITDIGTRSS